MSEQALDMAFVYPTYAVTVSEAEQAEKLACCNIPTDAFGEYVDITHFAVETIMAAKHGGVSINGSVHVSQEFEQSSPIRLGETLELSGRVTAVEPQARGEMVTSEFELRRSNGEVPLKLARTSLRADPTRMRKPSDAKAAASAQAVDPSWAHVASHQLEPEKVARYSIEAENLIHSDVDVARQFGFKAPIAGGLMAARMMMAHLWREGPLTTLRMSVRFKRPMFWDDTLNLYDVTGDGSDLVMLRASDNKVVNDAHIASRT